MHVSAGESRARATAGASFAFPIAGRCEWIFAVSSLINTISLPLHFSLAGLSDVDVRIELVPDALHHRAQPQSDLLPHHGCVPQRRHGGDLQDCTRTADNRQGHGSVTGHGGDAEGEFAPLSIVRGSIWLFSPITIKIFAFTVFPERTAGESGERRRGPVQPRLLHQNQPEEDEKDGEGLRWAEEKGARRDGWAEGEQIIILILMSDFDELRCLLFQRLRNENRLLKKRNELLEAESTELANRLVRGQVSRAEEEETM